MFENRFPSKQQEIKFYVVDIVKFHTKEEIEESLWFYENKIKEEITDERLQIYLERESNYSMALQIRKAWENLTPYIKQFGKPPSKIRTVEDVDSLKGQLRIESISAPPTIIVSGDGNRPRNTIPQHLIAFQEDVKEGKADKELQKVFKKYILDI